MTDTAHTSDSKGDSKPAARPKPTGAKPAGAKTTGIWKFVTSAAFLGALGTVLVSLLQYQSGYQDKVATLAKDDLAVATATFNDTANALSVPILFQQRLIYNFYKGVKDNDYTDDNADVTRDARDIYKPYADAYQSLNQNYVLLGQKVELYIDWASDPTRAASAGLVDVDPISLSLLGAFDFDCEKDMPSFAADHVAVLTRKSTGAKLNVDWYSAKHQLLAIMYCLNLTHHNMAAALQWASHTSIDKAQMDALTAPARVRLLELRTDNQVRRLNTFMSLAMTRIEYFRSQYQPHNIFCKIPFVPCPYKS